MPGSCRALTNGLSLWQTSVMWPLPSRAGSAAKRDGEVVKDGKGTPKSLCDKDFAELSGELSGAICLKTLVSLGSAPVVLFARFLALRSSFLLLRSGHSEKQSSKHMKMDGNKFPI